MPRNNAERDKAFGFDGKNQKDKTQKKMTNIELEVLSMAKAALRKYNAGEIDWEQRRYEIAKDVLASILNEYDFFEFKVNETGQAPYELSDKCKDNMAHLAAASVAVSDALIKQLKGDKK